MSKDDGYISNNAITSTRSGLKRDGVPQTENSSVDEEKAKKSKVDKTSKSHTEYLLWIKKTHKEITETWTKYKQQSTMELRQEIIHLTKRIQQQLDEFSDSSDETIIQEQISLENEVSNIKNELQKEDDNCLDEIAVTLQHADALITSYELDSTIFSNSDLLKLATMLDQAHSKLDDLNRKDLDQNDMFADKFSNLKDLYVKLVRRLQTLQQLRDHTAQVIICNNYKFCSNYKFN